MNFDFLYEMIRGESVSGGEIALQKKVAAHMREKGCEVKTDLSGNVIASIQGHHPMQVLLTGHIDEIGFRVTYITESGRLKLNRSGGIRKELMQGKRVTVRAKKPLPGVIGLLLKEGKVRTDVELSDMEVDCGFSSRAEAEVWVRPGDFVTYDYEYDLLENRCVAGRALDDKLGAFVVLESLLRAKEKGVAVGVSAATTVGEETSMRGAYHVASQLRPTLAIAVDVTHSSDYSGSLPETFGEIKLGGGPVLCRGSIINEAVAAELQKAADKIGMKLQYEVAGSATGTDADVMHLTNGGVPVAVLSIPLRYMHSPSELGSLGDVEACIELLTAFLCDLKEDFNADPFA